VNLADEARDGLGGAAQARWLDKLEAEHASLEAALESLLEHDARGCLRVAAAVSRFWELRGHLTEGRAWLAAALERGQDGTDEERFDAVMAAGNLATRQLDLAAARAHYEEGLRLARRIDNPRRVAGAQHGLGVVALQHDAAATAREYFEASLAAGRALGDTRLVVGSLVTLGGVARRERDWPAAKRLFEEALGVYQSTGERRNESLGLNNLAAIAHIEGEEAHSRALYARSLEISRELGNRPNVAYVTDKLAVIAADRGEWERAARMASIAGRLERELGISVTGGDVELRARTIAAARSQLGERFDAIEAETSALSFEETIGVVVDDLGEPSRGAEPAPSDAA